MTRLAAILFLLCGCRNTPNDVFPPLWEWPLLPFMSSESLPESDASEPQTIVLPPTRKVTLVWTYPATEQTTDLMFNVYGTADLAVPMKHWPWVTNAPGAARSLTLAATQPQQFFVLTASNRLGESEFGTTP